jgi:hypothetical protein
LRDWTNQELIAIPIIHFSIVFQVRNFITILLKPCAKAKRQLDPAALGRAFSPLLLPHRLNLGRCPRLR